MYVCKNSSSGNVDRKHTQGKHNKQLSMIKPTQSVTDMSLFPRIPLLCLHTSVLKYAVSHESF